MLDGIGARCCGSRVARRSVHERDLSGPLSHRERPRSSLPLHSQPRFQPGRPVRPRFGRTDVRTRPDPAGDPEVHRIAWRGCPLRPRGTGHPGIRGSSLPRFQGRRLERVPRAAGQRRGDRGGGRRSRPRVRTATSRAAPRGGHPAHRRPEHFGRPRVLPDGQDRCRRPGTSSPPSASSASPTRASSCSNRGPISSSPRSRHAPPSGYATATATASRPSARTSSSSTTLTRRSTSWWSSCARRRRTRTWCPSSRPCIARATTPPIVAALAAAAYAGKSVTALVELKGPVRRGAEPALGAQSRERRGQRGLWLRAAEDTRQGLPGGPARVERGSGRTPISAPATIIRSLPGSTPTSRSSPVTGPCAATRASSSTT